MSDPRAIYNRHRHNDGTLTWTMVSDVVAHWQADRGLVADGMFGPVSRDEWRRQFQLDDRHVPPSALADAAVGVAVEELGNGEEFANNAGAHVHRYRDYPEGDNYEHTVGDWCAFFVGYCFEQAADRVGVALPFDRRFYDDRRNRRMPVGSAKVLGRRIADAGRVVELESVSRGDVLVWDRGRYNSPAGHIGIVEAVDRDERLIHTIEGNVGAFPAKVKRRAWDLDRPGRLELVARI